VILLTEKWLKASLALAAVFVALVLYGHAIHMGMDFNPDWIGLGLQILFLFSGFYLVGKKITHTQEGGLFTVLFAFVFPVWAFDPFLLAQTQGLYHFNKLLLGLGVILTALGLLPYRVARIAVCLVFVLIFGYEGFQIHSYLPELPHNVMHLKAITAINPLLSDFWYWNVAALVAFVLAILISIKQSGLPLQQMEKEGIAVGCLGVLLHMIGLWFDSPLILLLAPGRLLVLSLALMLPRAAKLFLSVLYQGTPLNYLVAFLMIILAFPKMPMGFEGSAFCLLLLAVLNQVTVDEIFTKETYRRVVVLAFFALPLAGLVRWNAPWLYDKEKNERDVVAWVMGDSQKSGRPATLATVSSHMPLNDAVFLGWENVLPPFKDINSTFNRQESLLQFFKLTDKELSSDDKNAIVANTTGILGQGSLEQLMQLMKVNYLVLPRSQGQGAAYQNADFEVWVRSDEQK